MKQRNQIGRWVQLLDVPFRTFQSVAWKHLDRECQLVVEQEEPKNPFVMRSPDWRIVYIGPGQSPESADATTLRTGFPSEEQARSEARLLMRDEAKLQNLVNAW